MEFDKRNPFAAWGYEQEKYTSDTAPKFESLLSMEDSAFVNDGAVTEKAGTYNFDGRLMFFTNNENIAESLNIRRRKVDGKDIDVEIADNYNNAELNYYGIQPQDLMADTKAHAKIPSEPIPNQDEIWVKVTEGKEEYFIDSLTPTDMTKTTWYDENDQEIFFANPKAVVEDGYVKIKFTGKLSYWTTDFYDGDRKNCVFDGVYVKEVKLPDGLTKISNGSFYRFSLLENIRIPDSVKTIESYSIGECTSLEKINLPNGIETIDSCAFQLSSSLASIVIPDSVTSIGTYAFFQCSGLTNVHLGNGITHIENDTFDACSSLVDINIPNTVESIGNYAFYHCYKLESVELPDSVESIGNSVFGGCTRLASIRLGNSVSSIGEYAFNGCSKATVLELPASVESIGKSAFGGCSLLDTVKCYAENPPSLGQYVFDGIKDHAYIYVPADSINAYKEADEWNNYTDIIKAIPEDSEE